MAQERVRVSIRGTEYVFLTDGDPAEVVALAEKVETRISTMMKENIGTSLGRALVCVTMEAEEHALEADRATEAARAQAKEYLSETARCRSETERLRAELQQKEAKILELTAALAARKSIAPPQPQEEYDGQTRLELPNGRRNALRSHAEEQKEKSAEGEKVNLSPDDFIRMIDNLSQPGNGEKE